MKFAKSACIDSMYCELPFLERFEAAKKDGFEFIEFWNWDGRNAEDIKNAAQKAGVGISGFNGDASYSLIDPAQRKDYLEFLQRSVRFAQQIDALSVTIHSNALGDGGIVLNHYAELSDTVKLCSMFDLLKECAELAESSGIAMNLEPLNIISDHIGNFLSTTQMAAEMTELIGSPKLKVLYDIYHMQLDEGNLCNTITKYIEQIGHIHVADVPGRHEPGTGEINYHNIFSCLEKLNYQGRIGFELFPEITTAKAAAAIMQY